MEMDIYQFFVHIIVIFFYENRCASFEMEEFSFCGMLRLITINSGGISNDDFPLFILQAGLWMENTVTNEATLLTKSWERVISLWFYYRPNHQMHESNLMQSKHYVQWESVVNHSFIITNSYTWVVSKQIVE